MRYKFCLSSDGNSIIFFNNSTNSIKLSCAIYWITLDFPYYNGIGLGMFNHVNFDHINNSVDKILETNSLNLSNNGKIVLLNLILLITLKFHVLNNPYVFTLDLNKDFENSYLADLYNVPFENTN